MPKKHSTKQRRPARALVIRTSLIAVVCLVGATACSPEVGSERWCDQMKETPKVDWSTREAGDYAKHCIFKK